LDGLFRLKDCGFVWSILETAQSPLGAKKLGPVGGDAQLEHVSAYWRWHQVSGGQSPPCLQTQPK
jgi:hypothetical protein